MGKISHKKINWNARTNWEFWGCKENLNEAYTRYETEANTSGHVPLLSFGYGSPEPALAYAPGDVVTYNGTNPKRGKLAVVSSRASGCDMWVYIKFADGEVYSISREKIVQQVISPAEIPGELMALARAEAANQPIDVSKCPLKEPCACMKPAVGEEN